MLAIKEGGEMADKADKQQTIVLLEEDSETRRLLRVDLALFGYNVISARDEQDAFEAVRSSQLQADLILVNLVDKSLKESLNAGRRIRKHAKYDGHTPLIVIAEKYGDGVEGTDVNAGGNDWITYPEDHIQLQTLISRLIKQVPQA
jgi:PleD family two-component response regulator